MNSNINENHIPFISNTNTSSSSISVRDIENNSDQDYDPLFDWKQSNQFDPHKYTKTYMIGTTLIIIVPISICDIYFALANEICIKNSNPMSINLYQYLLISGVYSLISVSIFLYSLLQKIPMNIQCLSSNCQYNLYNMAFHTNVAFIIFWMIIGGFIIWFYDDDYSNCNNNLYNYLIVEFVLKITYIAYTSCLYMIEK